MWLVNGLVCGLVCGWLMVWFVVWFAVGLWFGLWLVCGLVYGLVCGRTQILRSQNVQRLFTDSLFCYAAAFQCKTLESKFKSKEFVSLCSLQQHVQAFGYDLMYFKLAVCYCSLDTGAAFIHDCFCQALVVSECGSCTMWSVFAGLRGIYLILNTCASERT